MRDTLSGLFLVSTPLEVSRSKVPINRRRLRSCPPRQNQRCKKTNVSCDPHTTPFVRSTFMWKPGVVIIDADHVRMLPSSIPLGPTTTLGTSFGLPGGLSSNARGGPCVACDSPHAIRSSRIRAVTPPAQRRHGCFNLHPSHSPPPRYRSPS